MTDIWVLYSTFPNRAEALSIAQALVESRLAACVNVIDSITSVYRWQGNIQQDSEVALVAKTQADRVDDAIAKIRSLHSYDIPAITAWPLAKGHGEFLQWVSNETAR